jgi:hypothetical protein
MREMRRTGTTARRRGGLRLARRLILAPLFVLAACAIPASAANAAAPALRPTVIHSPTNVPITPARDTIWQIPLTAETEAGAKIAPTAGRFRVAMETTSGKEAHTGLISVKASAEELQTALEKLKSIGPGNVEVTKAVTATRETYTLHFINELGGRQIIEAAGSAVEVEVETEAATAKEAKEVGEEEPPEPEVDEELALSSGGGFLEQNGAHDIVHYQVLTLNVGGAPTSGKVTITDKLPPGLTLTEAPQAFGGGTCKKAEAGATEFTCTWETVVNPSAAGPSVAFDAYVDEAAKKEGELPAIHEGEQLIDTATVSSGGAAQQSAQETATVSNTPAPFGITPGTFVAKSFTETGEEATQAGAHPYDALTSFFFNTDERPVFESTEEKIQVNVADNVKDTEIILPAGFLGNPTATEQCTQARFVAGIKGGPEFGVGSCPPNSQVGTATLIIKNTVQPPETVAFYNLVPPPGVPAEFGLIFKNVPVRIDGHLIRLPNGEYRVAVMSPDINEAYNVVGLSIFLWGTPADASHTPERFKNASPFEKGVPSTEPVVKPFLTNPLDCVQSLFTPSTTVAIYDRWQTPGFQTEGLPDGGANWLETSNAESNPPPVTGCDKLKFEPTASFVPETTQVGASSGAKVTVELPDPEDPAGLAEPELKSATVTLPQGVTLSASAANGLVACSEGQIALSSTARGGCPDASQVGSVTIKSQLLNEPLTGRMYLGQPLCDPCSESDVAEGKLLKLYIEAEGSGVRVKLPGTGTVNPANGQIATTFDENPQTPFTKLEVKLKGGEEASLANPQTCGTFTTLGAFTPWSIGGFGPHGETVPGTPVAPTSSAFTTTYNGSPSCPGTMPFSPSLEAGTENTQAAGFTTFDVVFKRGVSSEQQFSGTTVETPPGLLGSVAGIPRCQEPQANAGTCPAASRIATATSGAGAGKPYYVSGPVYLTEGYKGAPFGLSIAVPAKAGPFNLGTVVVRAAVRVNRLTGALSITSDALPQSKDGIPFLLKEIEVRVDRPNFMFNATKCEEQKIKAVLTGLQGTSVGLERPYTPTGCSKLQFKPKFTASTLSTASKINGVTFTVKVEAQKGESNIHKVLLQLPLALPSRLETLQKACLVATFEHNRGACPPESIVGSATAKTPLLNAPLKGPAYLVSHGGGKFPDLVFLLSGENGVEVELVGNTDIKNGITYSKFEAVPDAPITSFETVFPQKRYSVLGVYTGEAESICEIQNQLVAPTTIVGQNGATFTQKTKIGVIGCGPTIRIKKVKLNGSKSLAVTVELSKAGTVKLKGAAIKTVSRSLREGTSTITVALSKSGKAARKHHKKMKFTASVSSGGKTATKTASVKG